MQKEVLKKKQDEVNILAKKIKAAKTIVALDYQGLSVEKSTELRRKLRAAGCEIKVYKNNIARRAAETAGYKKFSECFTGPKAIAYSNDDLIAPAKIVYEFALKNKAVRMFAGVIDGSESTGTQMYELATLPSYEGLLTILAAGLLGIVTQLAVALNQYQEQIQAN